MKFAAKSMVDKVSGSLSIGLRLALERAAENLGITFGNFLLWIAREASASGADRIFFLSREGIWLSQHYEALRRTDPSGCLPPSAALAVSRRSTFLPSLSEVGPDALTPLIAQYRSTSVGAVIWSLGLTDEMSDADLRESLGPIERRTPWAAPGVAAAVLGAPRIAEVLEQRRLTQRRALSAYLAEKGLVPRLNPVIVIDIGWRGTIQDNLARLFPETTFTGLYFHLQPYFVSQAANTVKRAFIPRDAERTPRLLRRLRFAAPLEFVASDPRGSTLCYSVDSGTAKPILDESFVVSSPAKEALDLLHQRIAAHIGMLSTAMEPQAGIALQRVLEFLEKPDRDFVNLFFHGFRDDRFGAGELRSGAKNVLWADLARAAFSTEERIKLGVTLAESGWPWGLLKRDLPILAPLLRIALLALDHRVPANRN